MLLSQFLTVVNRFVSVVDFGVDHLCEMVQRTDFPWLLSNVIDNLTNKPLADGKESCIIDWNGYKVIKSTGGSMH